MEYTLHWESAVLNTQAGVIKHTCIISLEMVVFDNLQSCPKWLISVFF